MDSLAVVGLGPLGLAMARHLSDVRGEGVVGIDIDPGRQSLWRTVGGGPASGELDDAKDASTVFVAVSEGAAAVDIAQLLGSEGTQTVFVVSTLDPETAATFDDPSTRPPGSWYIPVTGGEARALRGDLVVITADDLPVEAERLLLRTIASNVIRVRTAREAALVKLLGNVLIAYQFAALAEIVDIAREWDVDPHPLLAALQQGSSGSGALLGVLNYPAAGLEKDLSLLSHEVGSIKSSDGPSALVRLRETLRAP